MQVLDFLFRQNSDTFDISHAFLPLTVAKLSTLKNTPVLAHPVYTLCTCAYTVKSIEKFDFNVRKRYLL